MPDLAHATREMRNLIKKNVAFLWLDVHDLEFKKARECLSIIRFWICSNSNRAYWVTSSCSMWSCSLTPAQRNYATAILWAVNKCENYLWGMPSFVVVTDHKPLQGAFVKPLAALQNARLQRIREKLSMYNFQIEWKEGKAHLIADALSRAPYFPPDTSSKSQSLAVLRPIHLFL